MRKIVIYVSCSLTHAPVEYKEAIALFKQELNQLPFVEILEFCLPPVGQQQSDLVAKHVYHNDIHVCVKKAHVIISEVTLPSTGLGFELGTAIEAYSNKPIIMYAKKNHVISKLIAGAAETHDNVDLFFYENSIMEEFSDLKKYLEGLYEHFYKEK